MCAVSLLVCFFAAVYSLCAVDGHTGSGAPPDDGHTSFTNPIIYPDQTSIDTEALLALPSLVPGEIPFVLQLPSTPNIKETDLKLPDWDSVGPRNPSVPYLRHIIESRVLHKSVTTNIKTRLGFTTPVMRKYTTTKMAMTDDEKTKALATYLYFYRKQLNPDGGTYFILVAKRLSEYIEKCEYDNMRDVDGHIYKVASYHTGVGTYRQKIKKVRHVAGEKGVYCAVARLQDGLDVWKVVHGKSAMRDSSRPLHREEDGELSVIGSGKPSYFNKVEVEYCRSTDHVLITANMIMFADKKRGLF